MIFDLMEFPPFNHFKIIIYSGKTIQRGIASPPFYHR